MDQLTTKANEYHDILDKELSKHAFFVELQKKTGVPKVSLVLGAVSVMFVLIFFNIGGKIITDLIGWVYPAYFSFKAIESPNPEGEKQWLTYWTVFGFINVVEYFADYVLYWFPFYYLFKTLFVLWLAMPSFKGAEVLYNSGLRQALLKYSPQIDSQAAQLKAKILEGKSF